MSTTGPKPGMILATLALGQFLMALDSSVMNVSIATVAADVGTTVSGVQTAITLYALVMAAAMITGGKIGQLLGRRRAFTLGCIVYGAGSLTTAIAPNLTVLLIGWSLLEGLGAALILPSIVAMIATNFSTSERPRAYGLVAAASAMAVAIGPLIGGAFTTYLSWRYVFVSEVVLVAVIVVAARRIPDAPTERVRLDAVGAVLSALALGLVVFGILRAGTWGFVTPKPDAPSILGLSPTVWLVVAGGVIGWLFLLWQRRLAAQATPGGIEPLVDPSLFASAGVRSGLTSFFMQFTLQAGVFFAIPLFLSVALGLSAIATGVRLLPLSAALLISAVLVPRLAAEVSPRRLVRLGFVGLLTGILVLIGALQFGAGPEIVTVPLLLLGTGIGTLSSQLGSVTVSSVPDERSGEVGGLQNTVTNLGASIGTALAGAVLISALTATLLTGFEDNPEIPERLTSAATVEMASGVPFVSDAAIESGLAEAGVDPEVARAIVDENAEARIRALRAALAVMAIIGVVALFSTGSLPTRPPGSVPGSPAA